MTSPLLFLSSFPLLFLKVRTIFRRYYFQSWLTTILQTFQEPQYHLPSDLNKLAVEPVEELDGLQY